MQVSRMLDFCYQPQLFNGFYRRERRSDKTLIEWDRDVDVLVDVFSCGGFLVEKSVVKLRRSETEIKGDMKNTIHGEWN